MSSSTFIDIPEEKDDQLIIIVNADGTITVDPETLEKLLGKQNFYLYIGIYDYIPNVMILCMSVCLN